MRPPKPPQPAWRAVPYIAASGSCEVLDYLEELKGRKRRSYEHFESLRTQIEARGPFCVGHHWEGVGDGLYEISWGRHRVYCSVVDPQRVFMYVAVYKLWPKFRASDRRKCEARRAEVLSTTYDEEQRQLMYLAHRQRREKK